MRTYLLELIMSTAIVIGWLAASLRLLAAMRHRQRRPRSFGDDAEHLARLDRSTARGRRRPSQEHDDPHAQWLGVGGAT